jgi:hypothetical protein
LAISLLDFIFGLFGIPRLAVLAPSPPVLVLLVLHLLIAADIDLIGLVVGVVLGVRSLQVVVVGSRVLLFLLALLVVFLSMVGWGVVGIEFGFSGLGRRGVELDVYQALHTA